LAVYAWGGCANETQYTHSIDLNTQFIYCASLMALAIISPGVYSVDAAIFGM
jgi:uncharacterized membrane protein YphA (DoxX/SURF4 family)